MDVTYNSQSDYIRINSSHFKKGHQYNVGGPFPNLSNPHRERKFLKIEKGWITCVAEGYLCYRKRDYNLPDTAITITNIETPEDTIEEFKDRMLEIHGITVKKILTQKVY